VRVIGCFVLGFSLLGGASIGSLSNFILVENPFAKNAWRNGINAIAFSIPALVEYFVQRKKIDYRRVISVKQYAMLLLTNLS
jgi:hypothetical protein